MSEKPEEVRSVALTDALLLERWREGRNEAFEEIFVRHYAAVYRTLLRLLGTAGDAEDAAQEVFLRLYRRPLPPGREHNLPAWLIRVATHLGYNVIRQQARRQRRQETWEKERAAGVPNPESEALRAETQAGVRQILAQLPRKQAQILFLRHQGYSYEELARIMAIRPSSVGTLLARAERAFAAKHVEHMPRASGVQGM